MPKIKITLISQAKTCANGHKIGDSWIVGNSTPSGLCMGAMSSLMPFVITLQFGGNFPWETAPGKGEFACPDGKVSNIFRIERID